MEFYCFPPVQLVRLTSGTGFVPATPESIMHGTESGYISRWVQNLLLFSCFKTPIALFFFFWPTFTNVLPTVNLCEESCIAFRGDDPIFNILLGLSFREVSLVLIGWCAINHGLRRMGMLEWKSKWQVSQEPLETERTSGSRIMGGRGRYLHGFKNSK